MKIFKVYRPFCSPALAIVVAKSVKEAIKVAHENFGFASDTEAKEIVLNGKRRVLMHNGHEAMYYEEIK